MIAALLLVSFIIYLFIDNRRIKTAHYEVRNAKLPLNFDDFKICNLSDVHNDEFGEDNYRLLNLLEYEKPDIIVFSGDLVDSRRTNTAKALKLVSQCLKIAPCYYVTGNHESRLGQVYKDFEEKIISMGVIVLNNKKVTIKKEEEEIELLGLKDPAFITKNKKEQSEVLQQELSGLKNPEAFSIALSHRPEAFVVYVNEGIELVLCGHAHGGQVRLPLIGGLYAPEQGLFPTYTAGIYQKEKTQMLVSRGLGQSRIPFRVFNPRELVVISLKKE